LEHKLTSLTAEIIENLKFFNVLHGFETRLRFRNEYRRSVFENKVLRKIPEPKKDVVRRTGTVYLMTSSVICVHRMLCKRSDLEKKLDGRGIRNVWRKGEMHTEFR
jgi:hypothetical protein